MNEFQVLHQDQSCTASLRLFFSLSVFGFMLEQVQVRYKLSLFLGCLTHTHVFRALLSAVKSKKIFRDILSFLT